METQNTISSPKTFNSYLILTSSEDTENILISFFKKLNVSYRQNSPDNIFIAPTSNSISIDEIRNLKKYIDQKPVMQNNKIAVISQADCLTPQAQNALLKVLEEPPIHSIIILIAKSQNNLLATIISRVVKIQLADSHSEKISGPEIDTTFKTLESTLEHAQAQNPTTWIDSHLATTYRHLLKNIENKDERQKALSVLEQTADAKKMIDANVNPKFVIANLILNSHDEK